MHFTDRSIDEACQRPDEGEVLSVIPLPEPLPDRWQRLMRHTAGASVVALIALVGTGGWVRLSESGLGCATWPKCFADKLGAHDSYHSLVEFANRCVIAGVGLLVVATLVLAWPQRHHRADLLRYAAVLVIGYVIEAVLGGLTVLRGLAPAVVAAHMILAMVLLADTVLLHSRAAAPASPRHAARGPLVALGRLLLATLAVVIGVGTVVTGSGPYAGEPGTPRLPLRLMAVTELHAVVGMFLLGLLAAGYLVLRAGRAPAGARRAYVWVAVVAIAQAGIGYLQHFTGLPVDLVELHMLGAAVLLALVVRAYLRLGAVA